MDITKITSKLLSMRFTMTKIEKDILRARSTWKGDPFEVEVTPLDIVFKPTCHVTPDWLATFATHASNITSDLKAAG